MIMKNGGVLGEGRRDGAGLAGGAAPGGFRFELCCYGCISGEYLRWRVCKGYTPLRADWFPSFVETV